MDKWMYVLLFLAIFCAAMYLLYRQGLGVTKRIAAILFVFRPGREADRATLTACTGWVSHRGRFRESRVYTFALDADLTQGEAEVTLFDQKKRQLFRLTRRHPTESIRLDGKSRYLLRWEFQNATGSCRLRW